MDSVVKKIQELDVSNPVPEGWYKRSSSGKADKIHSGSRGPIEAGPENPADSLNVKSMAVKDSSSRLPSRFPVSQSRLDSAKPGPSHKTREITGLPVMKVIPPVSGAMEALSFIDPSFISSVTAAELVCGERRYRCLGCLRYYDLLVSLLKHIQQGWREGFTCRVFYHKLRSMHECRDYMSRHRENAVSRYKPPFSDPSLAVSPAEARKSSNAGDKKADMIWKWLQTVEIAELPE